MRYLIRILFSAIIGLPGGPSLWAQSDANVFVGSRPTAMAGAYTAVADDANSMFYNTAGLHHLRQHEVTFMSADLYGTGIQANYLAYGFPLSRNQAIGLDWQHLGFGDDELGFNRDIIKLATSRKIGDRLAAGAGVKFLITNTSLDGQSVAKGSGIGFDLGVQYDFSSRIRLGLSVQDVTGSSVSYDGGGSATLLPRSIRLGVAYQMKPNLLLAADVDRKIHIGGEYRLNDLVVFRAGSQKDTQTSDPLELTFGIGVKYKAFNLDFTHVPGKRGLGQTQRYGFSVNFEPSPHLVKVIETQPNILYASYYKTFEGKAGSLKLENRHSEPLDCTIQITVPEFSQETSETKVTLAPKKIVAVPFRAVLSDEVMALQEDRRLTMDVRIQYATKRAQKQIRRSVTAMAFRPGSLTWDAPGKAAAFVTHQDPVIERFARGVYSKFEAEPPSGIPLKVYQAVLIFNALSEHGMRYVEDPQNPFSQVAQDAHFVDRISYPRETLRNKVGDCDDQVVAFCSLLENLNISSAFIEPPGHLLMMFDTGMNAMTDDEDSFVLEYYDWLYDAKDGSLWMPVEVTLLGECFDQAWHRGAEQVILMRKSGQFDFTPIRRAWADFQPAAPVGQPWDPDLPSKNAVQARVDRDLQWIASRF